MKHMSTFGNNPAAKRLEALLQDNPKARRKISTLLSQYTSQLLEITAAKNARTVILCMELLRDYTLRRLDVKTGLTDEMRSYAKNVVITRHRLYCQGFKLVCRIEQQKKT